MLFECLESVEDAHDKRILECLQQFFLAYTYLERDVTFNLLLHILGI